MVILSGGSTREGNLRKEHLDDNIKQNPMIDLDEDSEPVLKETSEIRIEAPLEPIEEVGPQEVSPTPSLDGPEQNVLVVEGHAKEDLEEDTVFDGILDDKVPKSDSFVSNFLSFKEGSTEQQRPSKRGLGGGDPTVTDSQQNIRSLLSSEEEEDSTIEATPITKKVASALREPRSVEDRRRRRLRQRRKFENVLRGMDDSSSLGSSTLSAGGSSSSEEEEAIDQPLISASFDTGFDPVPVIAEESSGQ